jgi:hypothetical protein
MATNSRVIKRRSALPPILGAVALVLILAAILIPGQIVSRVARDETSAMQSLRALTDRELQHAAAHPSKPIHLRICAVENGCAFERRANPRIDFYFLIHLTVTNSYLPDARSTRRDWPVGFQHFGLIGESKPRNIYIN